MTKKYCFRCGKIISCYEEYDNYCGKCGSELGNMFYVNEDESEFIAKEPGGGYIHSFCGGKVNLVHKNIAQGTVIFFCTYCGFRTEVDTNKGRYQIIGENNGNS